ncbi:TPA: DUF805 domain-containing protein [Listeria innocua]|uniref:Lin0680 protein n=1 Tax=Listeria innocua serovar 6a (strain ATCC BAA-680 / CLIP 11262) TaxID=272626 RepID=Q92DY1_LISIN|nr:DUF805 domain-containing protein [Listeria innocua]EAD5709665.1 DUF805 domain-containing protein [Listeria innocua]EAD5763921.1 DUF805 domain-containing protein [Listeria innocua]EAE2435199.1 DUF805 domain-containing protein [Listeria innocua]EAE2482344.1 DUF805 domain-containing protein [Listeria innocua]EAE6207436.1 DUF805 domain-containing protein [Listeria innocua]
MGFLEAYKSFWKNYVNFSGRAPRSAYWYVVLWNVIIFAVLYFLAFVFGISIFMESALGGTGIASSGGALFMMVLVLLYLLAVLLPTISLMVRRLHDSGKSGLYLLLDLIPFVGSIIMLVFMCLESDGPNQYGDLDSEFDI